MKNIVVAGCGHGGLVAAGLLSKAGYNVNVYEQKTKENLPYDWTDIFDIRALTFAGLELPPTEKYSPKEPMTLISPSKSCILQTEIPPELMEMKMERSDIYDHLLDFATNSGVKIHFGTKITAPLVKEGKVCGIVCDDKEIPADLVIDACGLNSTVRRSLPEHYNIVKDFGDYEKFYVYRAFYDRKDEKSDYAYKVYLFHQEAGISWVADEKKYVDILIGRLKPLTQEEIDIAVEDLRQDNPCLGDKVIRGGQLVSISIRKPIPLFVGDNYAAIGDSAGMTIPLIGSGIANCLEAAKILADTVISANGKCNIENLWPYQSGYMRRKADNASIDVLKNRLLRFSKELIDFAFDKKVISESDISAAVAGQDIKLTLKEILQKAYRGKRHLPLLISFAATMNSSKKLADHVKAIPAEYDKKNVLAWIDKYNKFK